MRHQKGAVAAGHPLTAEAAGEVLRAGGNAFDAALLFSASGRSQKVVGDSEVESSAPGALGGGALGG